MVKSQPIVELPNFPDAEYHQRLTKLRSLMREFEIDAVLLNSEANLEYFSGFSSPFPWHSPSRAMHVILPLENDPIGIVPELLTAAWTSTSWVKDIVTWPSPRPQDEGLSEIVSKLNHVTRRFGRIAAETGPETRIGMTVSDFLDLCARLQPVEVVDCSLLCKTVRAVKSGLEIGRVRRACELAAHAFDTLPSVIKQGATEAQVARQFQASALLGGADWVPFVAVRSGPGGYDSVVTGPSDRELTKGDVLVLDAGVKYRGYWCDHDRNFALGQVDDEAKRLHRLLYEATEAGIDAARPGTTAKGLFFAQARILENGGVKLGRLGRFGHGVGRQLTEQPSLTPADDTPIVAGMILSIEPAAARADGNMLVHEENILVTDDRPVLLSTRAPDELPIV